MNVGIGVPLACADTGRLREARLSTVLVRCVLGAGAGVPGVESGRASVRAPLSLTNGTSCVPCSALPGAHG